MAGNDNDEAQKEKLDRELIELLNELRVALPGIQVLFAFLLTVPFSQGFPKMTELQRNVFFATFLSTAVATVLLIAPTTYHRLRWRRYDKERLLVTSNRLSIGGAVFLALAMAGATFLIADVMFGLATAGIVLAPTAATLAWFWFGLPLTRRTERSGEGTTSGHDGRSD